MSAVPSTSGRAATVEFDHVSKVYESRAASPAAAGAVNDLSLSVPAGRICVLVGPSGCGKTTSLKMVNRLIEPTSGRILADGADINRMETAAWRERLGANPVGDLHSCEEGGGDIEGVGRAGAKCCCGQ